MSKQFELRQKSAVRQTTVKHCCLDYKDGQCFSVVCICFTGISYAAIIGMQIIAPLTKAKFYAYETPINFCPPPSQIQILLLMRDCQETVQVSCFLLGTLVEGLQARYF